MPRDFWNTQGENSPTAKLNEQKVMEIKKMLRDGATQREAAAAFGIAVSTVNRIVQGLSWSHVKLPK